MAYLTRFHPGRDFDLLRREMDRLFNTYQPQGTTGDQEAEQAVWAPRADFAETQDAFVLHLDLPGVQGADLQVTMEEDTLKIGGERRFNHEQNEGQYHRIERSYGRFFRAFRFSTPVDAERIEAEFNEGVLSVRIPKAEASKPRRIEVRERNAQAARLSGDQSSAEPETPEAQNRTFANN